MRWSDAGQVMILFAILLTVLLVLAGSAYDYGSILVDDAQLQNAVDASVLAGADALGRSAALPSGTPAAVARGTAAAYLALNGVATRTPGTRIDFAFPTSTPIAGGTPSSAIENMSLSVKRSHRTSFWGIVGIRSVDMEASGGAHASRNMLDIMLSLDATGSELLSGSWAAIQQAVVDFINVVSPTPTDPRGPRIGIARFAGIKCTWTNTAGDRYLHVYTAASPLSEYRAPCADDKTVLTNLTSNKQLLLKIANNSGSATCPGMSPFPAGQPVAAYACPLRHAPYAVTEAASGLYAGDICVDGGTNCAGGNRVFRTSVAALPDWVGAPYFTGTKLPNAFTVLSQVSPPPAEPSSAFYAWSTAQGGRNDALTGNNARKVMVMFTDGQNEAWPDPGSPEDVSDAGYGSQVRALAQALKLGPDRQGGTDDDVEIFVVGYFCTPYDGSSGSFCKSRLAASASPHPCPGPTYPPTSGATSAIDDLLVGVSSSSGGTCDHYYPLSKTETTSLPQLFRALAGSISRGQLTQ